MELDPKQLKEMFLHAWEKIKENEEKINKINVFPVPDQDTGTNLERTLFGIKEKIERKEFNSLKEISEAILEGALFSAQGNVGVIFTGFLSGFLPKLVEEGNFFSAFKEGEIKARKSISKPKEGTVLDVIEGAKKGMENKNENDLEKLLEGAIEEGKKSLELTRKKNEILKKANVVDAGGLSFLLVLESFLETISKKGKIEEKEVVLEGRTIFQILPQRYEVVALIFNPKLKKEEIENLLLPLGNCLDIVEISNKMKVHIHTDFPNEVKEKLREIGDIENLKIEDIAKEAIEETPKKAISIGFVTEDISSLSPKIIEKYEISLVNVIFNWPEIESLPGKNLWEKMRGAEKLEIKSGPKTSQPSPLSFFEAFKKQLEKFEKVICFCLSSKISGSFNSALQAREMLEKKENVFVIDTQNAIAGEALLILRAIELTREGREIEEILKEIEVSIPKTHTYLAIKTPKWLASIGRITEPQAKWIERMKKIGVQPLLEIKEGKIEKAGVVFAKDEAEALFKKVKKKAKNKKIRVVINHADNLEGAEKLKEDLKKIGAEVSFISLASEIVAILGPGSLIVGWQELNF